MKYAEEDLKNVVCMMAVESGAIALKYVPDELKQIVMYKL